MKPINNERGAVLVVALIIMGVLMVIGTTITMTTSIELNIARNEKVAKTAFYRAEGGRIIAGRVLRSLVGGEEYNDNDNFEANADITIRDGDFEMEEIGDPDTASGSPDVELSGSLSANVNVDKLDTLPLPGYSAEFASGYEGVGKAGGVQVIYEIDSIGSEPSGATSQVQVQYRVIPQ